MSEKDVCFIAEKAHQAAIDVLKAAPVEADHADWGKIGSYIVDGLTVVVQSILDGKINSTEDLHNIWKKYLENEGWTYGEERDLNKKQHPCLVEFDKLNPFVKIANAVFYGIVSLHKK